MNNSGATRPLRPVMTSSGADAERLECAKHRANSREATSLKRMEAIRALFDREDTIGALADYILC